MTKDEIISVINEFALQRIGIINKQEFGVDQGAFEGSDKKYAAYLIGNYNGDFYFDSPNEFLDRFIINGKPIGEQLDKVESFRTVQFIH